MIYAQLFDRVSPNKVVACAVIGTGHFATAIITQAQTIPRLKVCAVADLDVEAARRAFRRAGLENEVIRVCDSRTAALQALERHQWVIAQDPLLLMDLPLDVIVESTGVPEAGAKHALAAILSGKHVVMVNKETDVSVGPILHRLASQAGVVYTQVDGDQHGLLIALVHWARELGLEVLCAGKARDSEFVHDPVRSSVSHGRQSVSLHEEGVHWLRPVEPGTGTEVSAARHNLFKDLPQVGGYDLSELAIAANATGLCPEVETLYCPALHTREIPQVFCLADDGGILSAGGVIDAVTSLRYPEEAGLGGGVFLVAACHSEYSRHILASKGCLTNQRGTAALLYRPYHLCGVETPLSILCAGLLGISTGAGTEYVPGFDVLARTRRDLAAGEVVGNDHSPDLEALLRRAAPLQGTAPLPLHLGTGNRLAVDVAAGTLLTADMVQAPADSVLWQLRRQQDEVFS